SGSAASWANARSSAPRASTARRRSNRPSSTRRCASSCLTETEIDDGGAYRTARIPLAHAGGLVGPPASLLLVCRPRVHRAAARAVAAVAFGRDQARG